MLYSITSHSRQFTKYLNYYQILLLAGVKNSLSGVIFGEKKYRILSADISRAIFTQV